MVLKTGQVLERNSRQPKEHLTVGGRSLVDGFSLAEHLGVTRTTVWRLARSGRIGHYQIGRRWYFSESEVLEALRVPASAQVHAETSSVAGRPDQMSSANLRAERVQHRQPPAAQASFNQALTIASPVQLCSSGGGKGKHHVD